MLLRLVQRLKPSLLPITHVVGTRLGVQPHPLTFVGFASHFVAIARQHLIGCAALTVRMFANLGVQHLRWHRLPGLHGQRSLQGGGQGTQPGPVTHGREEDCKDGTKHHQHAPPHCHFYFCHGPSFLLLWPPA